MTENATQYSRYFAALKGAKLDLGARGDPPSGFFRFKRWRNDPPPPFQRTLALWRDPEGGLYASKNYMAANTLGYDEADELFTSPDCVAIPHALYNEIRTAGHEAWPEIHTTYLRTKDITAGLHWTEAWARKQLAGNVETHAADGERKQVPAADREVTAGDNGGPPTDPVSKMKERLADLGVSVAMELKAWGGAPRNKDDADRCADYINLFRDVHKNAEHHRVNEKEEFLKGCRETDAKWKPITDKAKALTDRLKAIAGEWIAKEEAARVAAAEDARAKAVAENTTEPVNEVQVNEKVTIGTGRQVSVRTRTIYAVTDTKLFMAHLIDKDIDLPSDLMIQFHKLANKLALNGVPVPGVAKTTEKKAS